jgi:hypothetical protein
VKALLDAVAASSASRVLPTPPIPVSVSSLAGPRRRRIYAMRCRRPTKLVTDRSATPSADRTSSSMNRLAVHGSEAPGRPEVRRSWLTPRTPSSPVTRGTRRGRGASRGDRPGRGVTRKCWRLRPGLRLLLGRFMPPDRWLLTAESGTSSRAHCLKVMDRRVAEDLYVAFSAFMHHDWEPVQLPPARCVVQSAALVDVVGSRAVRGRVLSRAVARGRGSRTSASCGPLHTSSTVMAMGGARPHPVGGGSLGGARRRRS